MNKKGDAKSHNENFVINTLYLVISHTGARPHQPIQHTVRFIYLEHIQRSSS